MTSEFTKLEIRLLDCFIGLALMFSPPTKELVRSPGRKCGADTQEDIWRTCHESQQRGKEEEAKSVKCWVS